MRRAPISTSASSWSCLAWWTLTCTSMSRVAPSGRVLTPRPAPPILAPAGVPLLVHAELDCGAEAGGDARSYPSYLRSRPAQMENRAIELLIRLCREFGCRIHVVHLSSAEALPLLADARKSGL